MSEKEYITENVNHASAEVEEIMGQVPSSIIRYGIAVITLVLILITAFAWFIRYPDNVKGPAIITTTHPPQVVTSRISASILHFPVVDSMRVQRGDILAVLGLDARIEDIREWKRYLDKLESVIAHDSLWLIPEMNREEDRALAGLQVHADRVDAALEHYFDLLRKESRYDQTKAESLHRRILEQQDLITSLEKQLKLLKQQSSIIEEDYQRDSTLAASGGISVSSLEEARQGVLQHEMEMERTRAQLAGVVIRQGEYRQQLNEFLSGKEEEMQLTLLDLQKAVGEAKGAVNEWEEKHVYRSQHQGVVSLSTFWGVGQEVAVGDILMHVIPRDKGELLVKVELPLKGSGLVEPGAQVLIRLNDYPEMEYGILKGKVVRVSAVPEGNKLMADVSLPQGLRTSYGEELRFRGTFTGEAEIITRDARLLERIIRPLRYLLKHDTEDNI